MNKYFYEVFENIPRQGPGQNVSTRKAFDYIKNHLPSQPEILDIGCGKGVQTLEIAKLIKGKITAIDNHQFFLDCLTKSAKNKGLQDKITCINVDMNNMPFQKERFDVIWAEGSVFIVGIEAGLRQWKQLLKTGGFLVLTDLVWLNNERPEELTAYWEQESVNLFTIDQVIEISIREGYRLITRFTLPDDGWLKEYILPQEQVLRTLKTKYASVQEAQDTFSGLECEHEIIKKYLGCFGYEFFIWKNKESQ